MKLYVVIFFLILVVFVCFVNGYVALICFALSLFMISHFFSSEFILLYIVTVFLSFVFSFGPLLYKIHGYNPGDSMDVYMKGIDQSILGSINDCDGLQEKDYGRFFKVKDEILLYCMAQPVNDTYYFYVSVLIPVYSFFYTEFSLASAFIPAPKRKNKCLEAIEQLLKICPEQKFYFNQEALQALRDFESKQ
ncbi:hypothetical protein FTQ05_21065 [Salmonella enterica]|nr:hypothetical protein [Salmonella enterica]